MMKVFFVWTKPNYSSGDVKNLYFSMKKHLSIPFDFYCLTDQAHLLKSFYYSQEDFKILELDVFDQSLFCGWWAKLLIFEYLHFCQVNLKEKSSEFAWDTNEDIFFLDLDTIILGPIDHIIMRAQESKSIIMLRDFYRSDKWGSGLMYLPKNRQSYKDVCLEFREDKKKQFRGDQDWIQHILEHQDKPKFWQDILPKNVVVSYKIHCDLNFVPPESRIVCFHGNPKPTYLLKESSWIRENYLLE